MNSTELDKIVENFKEVLKEIDKAIEEKKNKEEEIKKKADLMGDKLELTIDNCVKSFRKALTAVINPDDPMFANSKHKLTAEEVEECLPDAGSLKYMLNTLADKTIDLAINKVIDKY
jgi:dsDNA-specific endonuclease/ATPase MutS2